MGPCVHASTVSSQTVVARATTQLIAVAHVSRHNCLRARRPSRSSLGVSCAAEQHEESGPSEATLDRRSVFSNGIAAAVMAAALSLPAGSAMALPGFQKDMKKSRRVRVPVEDYTDGLDGLKIYEVKLGTGALAEVGARVAVHYEARWRGVTFITSRQGMGVTGGSPIGFDVGAPEEYGTLPGLDLGVRGMRVGGQRKLLVPPNLAYGDRGVGEIPPGATLEFDVELLSIKSSPFGSRVKLVEG